MKTYNTFRETAEEEEMRYFIKGRDFVIDLCGMIDNLSPFMEMMIRVQAMDQLIWTITILMPKVRSRLNAAKEALDVQLLNNERNILPRNLFLRLSEYFLNPNKDDTMLCLFENVPLREGWIIVGKETVENGKTIFLD